MIQRELLKDCLVWFKTEPGLGLPPDIKSIREYAPDLDDRVPMDEAEDAPLSRGRLLRACVHGLAFSLALSLVLLLWGGWWSTLAFLALALVTAACYGIPVALAVTPERLLVRAEHDPAPALARTIALAHFNQGELRLFLHVFLDILLFPLVLSCQEGAGAWAARSYCRDRGLDCDPPRSLRGRLSAWPLSLLARMRGKKAAGFVLKYL